MTSRPLRSSPPAVDLQRFLDEVPYARHLGLRVEHDAAGARLVLPFRDDLVGNPHLPAIHGGVMGAFLELAALVGVAHTLGVTDTRLVDVEVDYLRSTRPVDCRARATIVRRGRRVANVRAVAWQDDEARPVTACRAHVILREEP